MNTQENSIFELIKSTIINNIKNKNITFVYPTDVAAFSWAEWTIKHTEIKAVPEEKFTAWDKFKGSAIKITQKDKNAVPSLLRKIFSMQIIEKNKNAKQNGEELIFKQIINPDFIDCSDSFSDWIANILPSLALWKKKFDSADKSKIQNTYNDLENVDYERLYTEYKEFLDQNNLFEPSWETANFSDDGEFIIFFPEILEDFAEYKDILENSKNIKLITLSLLKTEETPPTLVQYSNARAELRNTVLKIRNLHENEGIEWQDISLCVPGINTSRPYIERELQLYNIPYVLRAGSSYTKNSAGRIFIKIRDCKENNFSYDSVRSLLMDGFIPWKDKIVNENLVREGYKRKCICTYFDNEFSEKAIDTWEESLAAGQSGNTTERENQFYRSLKSCINRFFTAQTFKEVQTAWYIFRETFLDSEQFSEDANLILGRCISELDALIDIEDTYNAHVSSPFAFFIKELESKTYQKQQSNSGISVFDYKLSGPAFFEHQFIINANQSELSVQSLQLSFLNKEKRSALGIDDVDIASTAFIRLYAKTNAHFSCSEDSFEGFSIPHSYFKTVQATDEGKYIPEDFIKNEVKSFEDTSKFPDYITENQKNSFEIWKNCQKNDISYDISDNLRKNIDNLLKINRDSSPNKSESNSIHITESDMKVFFPCPRKWLFSQVLKLREDTLNANLLNPTDDGTIRHKILELFMNEYQGKCLPLAVDGKLPDEETVIIPQLNKCVENTINSPEMYFKNSPLVKEVLLSQKDKFTAQMTELLRIFCKSPEENGFGGYKVFAAEKKYNVQVPKNDFYYNGKIDCILSDENGNITIIDYKLSNSPKPVDCIIPKGADPQTAELNDFQMQMYISLLELSNKNISIENAIFFKVNNVDKRTVPIVLENAKDLDESKIHEVRIEEFRPTLECFEEYAKRFDYETKNFELDISGRNIKAYDDCIGCTFKTICRTNFDVAGNVLK